MGLLLSSPSAQRVCDALISKGAILTLPGAPLIRHLIGEVRWLSPTQVLVLSAFGETSADVLEVNFDDAEPHLAGVCFVQGNRVSAFLSLIENARVGDPDDYRVAWSLWQEVRPLRHALTAALFDSAMVPPAESPDKRRAALTPAQRATVCASL